MTTFNTIADFGPLVIETDVDDAVESTLRLWLPTYLTKVESERGLAAHFLPRPSEEFGYATVLEDDTFPDSRLPLVVVTTSSITDPEKGTGAAGDAEMYHGSFDVVVSAIVRGPSKWEARRNAALYGGSIRRLLIDHPALGGMASETWWIGGHVMPVSDVTSEKRELATSISTFKVYVDDLLQVGVGPFDPDPPSDPDDPYDPPVTVTDVTINIDGLAPGGSL